jgi:hypothetical protein
MTIKSKIATIARNATLAFGAAAAIGGGFAVGGLGTAAADPQIIPDGGFRSHWEDVVFTPDGGYDKIACETHPVAGWKSHGIYVNPTRYSRSCVSAHYRDGASFDDAMANRLPHTVGDRIPGSRFTRD